MENQLELPVSLLAASDKEAVITWLAAADVADYRAGVLLLQEHSGNRGLVNNLLKKESPTNREKLVYELVKVLCEGRMHEVSETLSYFAQAVQGAVPLVQQVADVLVEAHRPALAEPFPAQPAPEPVPAAVQGQVDDLTQLMQRLYTQRVQLSNRLPELGPSEPEVVGQILDLQNQYNALAEKRRRVVAGEALPAEQPAATPETGAPGAEAAPTLDRAALLQQRNSLRSRVSKSRKASTEAKTEEKRSEHAQKVGRLEAELGIIELQLALPQA